MTLLQNQRDAVEDAKIKLQALSALDKHNTLVAKHKSKHLLISAKGLGACFAAGSAKALISDSKVSKSQATSILGKQLLSALLV